MLVAGLMAQFMLLI